MSPLPNHAPLNAAHLCPRCRQVRLVSVIAQDIELEQCSRCKGIWIDIAVFGEICVDRSAQDAALGVDAGAGSQDEHGVVYLKCPQCAELMNRSNFARGSGVVIDRCSEHGVWFDPDEMRRIIDFIRTGGLSRARQLDSEEASRAQRQRDNDRALSNMQNLPGYGAADAESWGTVGAIADLLSMFWP